MKISVSLLEEDVEFLDQYAREIGASSRSAVVQQAIRAMKARELAPAYAEAWKEWAEAGESEVWETAVGDGLENEAKEK